MQEHHPTLHPAPLIGLWFFLNPLTLWYKQIRHKSHSSASLLSVKAYRPAPADQSVTLVTVKPLVGLWESEDLPSAATTVNKALGDLFPAWSSATFACQATQYTDALFGPAIFNDLASAFEFQHRFTL